MNSYYDQKDYAGRSVHYWKVVLPLLEKIRNKRSIPEPLEPMFMHFQSRDIQVWTLFLLLFQMVVLSLMVSLSSAFSSASI